MTIKLPKAIFFDIDGTLISFKTHEIPSSAKTAILKLKENGIKVFIATGRPLFMLDKVMELDFDGYITVNGGYCITRKKEIIYENAIAESDIRSLIQYNKTTDPFPCLYVRENDMLANIKNKDVDSLTRMLEFPEIEVYKNDSDLDKKILQVVCFFDEQKEKYILSNIMTNCEATRWYPTFADVLAKGNSKQVGIDKVLEYYNLSLDETMAFGDGGNDISMLKHVATGIAMGNARDEVKAVADYVTSSIDDDGIYKALQHFNLID